MIEANSKAAKPFIKWLGGKRQMLPHYEALFPKSFKGYYEPFLGGGSIFFHMLGRMEEDIPVILGDVNPNLIWSYYSVQKHPFDVLNGLRRLAEKHNRETYDKWRKLQPIDPVDIAVRFMYLNRAAFNGLWRENKKGEMNAPIGDTPAERLFDYDNLVSVHDALSSRKVQFLVGPFAGNADKVPVAKDWFVYCDPPYHGTFSGYSKDGFNDDAHILLRDHALDWHRAGAKVMLSNSDTPFIRELFADPIWNITTFTASRRVAGGKKGRTAQEELVIRNY